MGREPVTLELEGCFVTSKPLKYEKAEDLLPEIGQLIAGVFEHGAKSIGMVPEGSIKSLDVVALASLLGPVLTTVADKLGAGTLKRLAPLLLAETEVILEVAGSKERLELSKPGDRAKVFDEHPEHYFAILFFAGKVTFARFFPVSALLGLSGTKVE